MDSIRALEAYFSEFPSIGPRQARRFVYFLLHKNKNFTAELSKLLSDIHNEVHICKDCFRIFPISRNVKQPSQPTCSICLNPHRDSSILMVVSRDIDLDSVEKSGVYTGRYFVLGGTVPILEKEPEKKVRVSELKARIERAVKTDLQAVETKDLLHEPLKEIIIATSANPEGENTGDYVRSAIAEIAQKNNINISYLGRGLSTGTELEYSDKETLKNALAGRK